MTDIKEIAELKAGRFEIDCQTIELVQDQPGRPKAYRGPGIISQNEQGVIGFKIFTAHVENTDPVRDLQDNLAFQSGTIIDASECFTLTATDYNGSVWTAKQVLPQNTWYSSDSLVTVGSIDVLSQCGLLPGDITPTQNYIRMHFFVDVDVACSDFEGFGLKTRSDVPRNFSKFSAANCDFELHKLSNEFVIQATSDRPLPLYFDARILETLQFVLARSLQWRALIERRNTDVTTQVASGRWLPNNTRLPPPITSGRIENTFFTWKLFGRYLEYVIKDTKTRFWHPCSAHLHNACEASANSVDAWAVGLCVAVEGISNQLAVSILSDTERKEVQRLRTLVKRWTECRKWAPDLTNRTLGLLSQLNNARVQDRLLQLARDHKVDTTYIKSWSTLRNRRVHAAFYDPSNLSIGDLQNVLLQISQTTLLMYQIVFHLIGYEGDFTDYATLNFPTKQYPLLAESCEFNT